MQNDIPLSRAKMPPPPPPPKKKLTTRQLIKDMMTLDYPDDYDEMSPEQQVLWEMRELDKVLSQAADHMNALFDKQDSLIDQYSDIEQDRERLKDRITEAQKAQKLQNKTKIQHSQTTSPLSQSSTSVSKIQHLSVDDLLSKYLK